MAQRSTSKPKLSPEQMLMAAVMLMEEVAAQLQPKELQRVAHAREYLQARQPVPRELVLLLQQDYMRLRAVQMGAIDQMEDASPHLYPDELETVHEARIVLESGRPASNDLMRRLGNMQLRVLLPQILESLENQSPLLSDEENGTVRQAQMSLNLTGVVHPVLQQKILKLQQNLMHRQHMGMI